MNEEIKQWSEIYQQQESSMTHLTIELPRVRGRDRRRFTAEGLATLFVVGAAIYYLALGTITTVFTGIGLLLFVVASIGYTVLHVRGIEEAYFAAPKDYLSELEARNGREISRLEPTWYLYTAGFLFACVNLVALVVEWDAYVAAPGSMVGALIAGSVILGGVVYWRRRELRRLEAERTSISELSAEIG